MAGSYRHVTNDDGTFRGIDLIDNLGDAYEALEEMHQMIAFMANIVWASDPKVAIHQAWRWGVDRPPENTANEALCGFDAFWDRAAESDDVRG